jgi:hypothetical protein
MLSDGNTPMMIKIAGRLTALLGFIALSACASTGTSDRSRASTCQPDAAMRLVGQLAPDNEAILRRTHSTIIRRLAPGDATTKDYREERVTVTVAEGRIVSASCG